MLCVQVCSPCSRNLKALPHYWSGWEENLKGAGNLRKEGGSGGIEVGGRGEGDQQRETEERGHREMVS